jgi:divalent metal cation (Fe/Co/Zn/Cd) transporter
VNILFAGWRIVRGSVAGLMDEALPAEETERLGVLIRGAMGPALEFHDLRTRRSGAGLFIELHLVVSSAMSVGDSHAICDHVETAILQGFERADVTIHVEPESERTAIV